MLTSLPPGLKFEVRFEVTGFEEGKLFYSHPDNILPGIKMRYLILPGTSPILRAYYLKKKLIERHLPSFLQLNT